ncbi:ABC transporter ATP-binding protein [Actinomadura rugatobispora]|uniref:ABC transporter ATP-binding protein n=1 Tax=Actinomadura rugatobispora TaxID=1994 RepID=A0ABW0ZX44_9ACTN|nr:ABC transporter ATP-binding protein [Actinomadura rugatobispora]
MRLDIAGLTAEIGSKRIISDIDLVAEPGRFVGLIGPNGSGKSTLLRTVYRALRPTGGIVSLDGRNLWRMPARQAARQRAVVTQHGDLSAEFSVGEVVAMGRAPHKGLFERENAADRAVVDESLKRVDMLWAIDRLFSTLSGGERQRVLVGRALAQEAPLLVLDEPTNHLDVRAQLALLDLIRSLGLTLLAALHDLDHAAAYCDHLVVLQDGQVRAAGAPLEVLTPEFVAEVFGVRAHIGAHPITGRPHIAVASFT